MHGVGALILAAGGSTRLGQPKQFLRFQGETLLRRIAKTAHAAGCTSIVAVVGDFAERVRDELQEFPVQVVENANWRSGIGSSIKRGVAQLQDRASAIVILTCDQPFVSAELIRKLLAANYPIAASAYAGTVGIPALFKARYFHELARSPDEAGAKLVIEAHPEDVSLVPFPEGAIDIDTPADYEALSA